MRHLVLCILVAGVGCSDSRTGDGSSLAEPEPVLIKYSDDELRGSVRVKVSEGGEALLLLDARNEQEEIGIGLAWIYKWTGSASDLRGEFVLDRTEDVPPGGGHSSSALLKLGGAELRSKSGTARVSLENGIVSGDFNIAFEGQVRAGTFSGKLQLSCYPYNDGSVDPNSGAGSQESDGGAEEPNEWRNDPKLETEFCRGVKAELGL